MRPIALIAVLLLSCAACTNQSIYEGIQTSNRLECSRQPPSQYDECIERNETRFEDYERERESVADEQRSND